MKVRLFYFAHGNEEDDIDQVQECLEGLFLEEEHAVMKQRIGANIGTGDAY